MRSKEIFEKQFVKSVIDASEDTIFVFNPQTGKPIMWNNAFSETSGYKNEEIQSLKAPVSYYSEDDLKKAEEATNKVLESGIATLEMELITKNGQKIPYEYTGTTLRNSDGTMLIVSIGRNITKRKAIENQLKESELKFRNLYEEAPNAYFSIGIDKSIIRCNKAAERLLGYTKDEFIQMKVFDLYANTKNGLEKAKNVFKKFLDGETIKDEELQMKNKNGETVWISLSVKPIIDIDGNVIESRSMILDITKRKNAEKLLKESEKKFRRIFETIPDLFFLVSNDTTVLEYKGKVDDLYITPDKFLGKKLIDLLPKEIAKLSLESIKKTLETHEPQIIEYSLTMKNGIHFYEARNLYFSKEKVLVFIRDITERKNTEKALKLSEKKYRESYDRANFYKDLFTHDMNNILQIINSSAELISFQLGDSEQSKHIGNMATMIKNQVERGSKLISNVRTLSEIEEKEVTTNQIEINTLLKNSIDFVKEAYSERQINISTDNLEDKIFINANELLQDVFENILINGIKYNENSTVEISIKISKQKIDKRNYVKIEFIDNGIGVADNRKEVIFKQGYREFKGSKGMGLGLSLVSKILNTFDGKIWVEDRVKGDHTKGSNFILLLPATK